MRHEPEGDFRNIEDRLPLSRFGDAQDVLTGGDNLAGFGVDRGNDPVDVRMKLGIAEIFPSERQFRLGRVAPRLGSLQVANRGVIPLLGGKAVFEERALPRLFRLRPGRRAARGGRLCR